MTIICYFFTTGRMARVSHQRVHAVCSPDGQAGCNKSTEPDTQGTNYTA